MSAKDREYQHVVDRLAEELLRLTPRELLAQPDYGSVKREARGSETSVAFWHHAFSPEKHHIVFKASRSLFLFFGRSYISGVVFSSNTSPRLMTPSEAGDYD